MLHLHSSGLAAISTVLWIISLVKIASVAPSVYHLDKSYESHYELPSWLPRTYTDFKTAFFCNNEPGDFDLRNQKDSTFIQSVLSARHTTWTRGWEVTIANVLKYNQTVSTSGSSSGKYYARVFDLLNWCRLQNLLPQWIDIDTICHKGMERMFGYTNNQIDAPPEKPNKFIPDKMWSRLWSTCHKQLNAQNRISSSCINIPAVVVANPNPPSKVNNPCHYEFRMIDGAHRLCLRKYLHSLIEGELLEHQLELANLNEENITSEKDRLQYQIMQLQVDRNHLHHGSFFILNQTTFESMLTDVDPYVSWAKDEQVLMRDVSDDMKLVWNKWMYDVMAHIRSYDFARNDDDEEKNESNSKHAEL